MKHSQALKSHLIDLYKHYLIHSNNKQSNRIYFINLIDKSGSQGSLGRWLYAAFHYLTSNRVNLLNYSNNINNLPEINSLLSLNQPIQLPDRIEKNKYLLNSNHVTTEDFIFSIQKNDLQRLSVNSITKQLFTQLTQYQNKIRTKFIWFDYHTKFKQTKLLSLKEIYNSMKELFDSKIGSYYSSDKRIPQDSIVRTNCIDCLDRTNVVQTTIARWILIKQLKDYKLIDNSEIINDDSLTLPDVDLEQKFRNLWGDNGDNMSLLYAGTKALKRDVTRLGKRTNQGAIDDGLNSVMRYYINNNNDYERQKGLDILLGIGMNKEIDIISESNKQTLIQLSRIEETKDATTVSPSMKMRIKHISSTTISNQMKQTHEINEIKENETNEIASLDELDNFFNKLLKDTKNLISNRNN